jgi:ketosteroid isomerase-like protein
MDEAGAWIARAAIAELITRYAALSDAGDWDALAALYTEEGRMNRPTAPEEFISGRAAILAALRARPRRIARHIVANVLVTLEGDARARATSQILLFTGSAAADGGLPTPAAGPPLIGSYEDTLAKTAEGWRFAVRRGSLDFRA